MTTISPKIMRFARAQQRKARERAERERIESEPVDPRIEAIPVFDRGRDPLIFSTLYGDDHQDQGSN